MAFDVEITLPSGKIRRVEELNNRDYLTISKYAENGDYKGLNLFFEKLSYIDSDLNIYDRFYLLIYVRMLFVDDKIHLTRDDDQMVEVSLISLLNRLEENYKDFTTTFTEGIYTITLDLPFQSYFNSVDEMLTSCIRTIDNSVSVVDFFELTEEDKTAILNNLPVAIFNRIRFFLNTISDSMSDITLIDANESIGVNEFNVNIIGNGVMGFLTSLFSTSLKHVYEMIYIFTNTVTPGSDIYFDLSPIEARIILNTHNKRIQEQNQNDQLQKKK
jgi:hypothetical protein